MGSSSLYKGMNMEFDLNRAVKSTYDSVTVIDNTIASGKKTQDNKDAVKRNYEHIEIILEREEMKDMKASDRKAFTEAVARGKAFAA